MDGYLTCYWNATYLCYLPKFTSLCSMPRAELQNFFFVVFLNLWCVSVDKQWLWIIDECQSHCQGHCQVVWEQEDGGRWARQTRWLLISVVTLADEPRSLVIQQVSCSPYSVHCRVNYQWPYTNYYYYYYYYYIWLLAFFQDNLGKLVPER